MAEQFAVFPIPDDADPATRAFIERVNAAKLPYLHDLTPAEARTEYSGRADRANFPAVPVGGVEDVAIPAEGRTIGARLYRPPDDPRMAPMLFYFHGGGFVIGDLETHDPICRRICRDAEALVLAVDYRLAPEHPFPAAVEDAISAFDAYAPKAAGLGADPSRLWVGGDSAGGTLAAVLAKHATAKDADALAGQILIYPALDRVGTYSSHIAFAETFPIPTPTLNWFDRHYFQEASDKASPLASPGHGEVVGAQAPALILSAGLDPLRDEAAAYAERLAGSGTPVRYRCFEGTIHGFLDKGSLLPVAGDAIDEIVAALTGNLRSD